ncbi:MAG: hypothetical protein DMD96_21210 [Candidatus Rokuibacteriota bacterium]|nr:MAG: hypothetical protein DMD96_21210 [Candidatus Rokubacteria bacterium]
MAEHEEITEYLKAAFPTAQVPPPSDHATTVAPVFPVIEGDVERQLEICRPIWNDFKEHTVLHMLRTNRVAETMRDQPDKRIVLSRDRCGELIVEIEPLRKA